MTKRIITIILLSLFSHFLFSVSVDTSLTLDTYSGEKDIGISFGIEGNLLDNLVLASIIDYEGENTYTTYSQIQYISNYFTGTGSFGFYINETSLYPSFGIEALITPFKHFGFELTNKLAINPYHIFSTAAILNDTDVTCYLYTSKYVLSLDLGYLKDTSSSIEENSYSGKLEILGRQQDIPLQINFYTETIVMYNDAITDLNDIQIMCGGGFKYDFGKFGTYYIDSEITAFSLEDNTQPFSITIGIIYKLTDSYSKIETTRVTKESVYEEEESFEDIEKQTDESISSEKKETSDTTPENQETITE
ncbi:MAG: hypothetical protein BKP49_08275 [Treponema sp. CETP13]|nr:MAG: hypothetical protein BKP49_08275 [Treponema sp. CETP13]